MRIATGRATSNYLRRLEKNYSQKFDSEMKISSFRQFQYASEAPAQAATAMRVRKAIANLNNYQENLKTADSIYSTAESAVMAISSLIQSTYEKCIEAANGTHTQDQMEILADEIDTFADEMCRLMNLTVADRRIFGGTNNNQMAFTIEGQVGSKYVTYNGVPVNRFNDPNMYPFSNPTYTDVGLGMMLNENGVVDEQSALQITFNGVDIMGCGVAKSTGYVDLSSIQPGNAYQFNLYVGGKSYTVDLDFTGAATLTDSEKVDAINNALAAEDGLLTIDRSSGAPVYNGVFVSQSGLFMNNRSSDQVRVVSTTDGLVMENQTTGYSNNVIQNILDAAQCIREGNGTAIARFADQVYSLQTTVSLALSDFGHTTQFIEFNQNRLTNNLESLTERQNDLESTDLAAEASTRTLLDAIFSASLQMTSSAVPQSIFDFIR